MTIELKFIGKRLRVYNGVDSGIALHLRGGDIVGVSDAKATQLLTDFPEEFQKTSGPREAKPEVPAKSEPKEPMPVEEKPSGKVPAKNKAIAPKKAKRK